MKRVKQFSNRGVVMNKAKTIEEVYKQRHKLYSEYADITITLPKQFHIKYTFEYIMSKLSI